MIKPRTKYNIKGTSEYFKERFGTSNPVIEIEDTDIKVFGKSWGMMDGNPTAIIYAMRSGLEGVPIIGTVYYGKINGYGFLVHEVELGAEVK